MSPPERSCDPALLGGLIVENILVRFPPDEPECLARASLVCKGWHGVLDDPGFRRRYGKFHHRKPPPMLGLLHNNFTCSGYDARFAATAAFSPQNRLRYDCYVFDSRHGLVLMAFSEFPRNEDMCPSLVVWDPITDVQWRVPFPRTAGTSRLFVCWNAAVLCAVDGCDHVDCHGNPFLVAFVGSSGVNNDLKYACVYSSEAGAWSGFTCSKHPYAMDSQQCSVLLAGKTVYFPCQMGAGIMEYNVAEQKLSWFGAPLKDHLSRQTNYFLVTVGAEDGGNQLGFVREFTGDHRMYMWTRVSDANGALAWGQPRVIQLDKLVPGPALLDRVICFVEGSAEAILLDKDSQWLMSDLNSPHVRKLVRIPMCIDDIAIPYKSFYTPRTSLERAQGLLQKGSDAMAARDFVDAVRCLGRAHEIRAAFYGELSPECAMTCYKYGFALLRKAQEGIGLNILKGARNKEPVRRGTSQGGTGKSESYVSNVTDAPSSEKGHTVQWHNSNGKYQEDVNHDSYKDDGVAGDKDYFDLDLAWKMLDNAREIVEKSPDHTMEKVKIFSALAAVSMEREDIDNSLDYSLKALAILDNLVWPDHHQIIKLHRNCRLCSISELASKTADAIPYCAKAISLCKSRMLNLKRAKGNTSDNASSAEGGAEQSALDDAIKLLTSVLVKFEKKLEGLEQELSTPTPAASEVAIDKKASGEQNAGNSMRRPEKKPRRASYVYP